MSFPIFENPSIDLGQYDRDKLFTDGEKTLAKNLFNDLVPTAALVGAQALLLRGRGPKLTSVMPAIVKQSPIFQKFLNRSNMSPNVMGCLGLWKQKLASFIPFQTFAKCTVNRFALAGAASLTISAAAFSFIMNKGNAKRAQVASLIDKEVSVIKSKGTELEKQFSQVRSKQQSDMIQVTSDIETQIAHLDPNVKDEVMKDYQLSIAHFKKSKEEATKEIESILKEIRLLQVPNTSNTLLPESVKEFAGCLAGAALGLTVGMAYGRLNAVKSIGQRLAFMGLSQNIIDRIMGTVVTAGVQTAICGLSSPDMSAESVNQMLDFALKEAGVNKQTKPLTIYEERFSQGISDVIMSMMGSYVSSLATRHPLTADAVEAVATSVLKTSASPLVEGPMSQGSVQDLVGKAMKSQYDRMNQIEGLIVQFNQVNSAGIERFRDTSNKLSEILEQRDQALLVKCNMVQSAS